MARSSRAGWIARWSLATFAAAGLILFLLPHHACGEELDPLSLTKYLDPLPIPGVMPQAAPNYYEVGAYQIQQQLHSQLPPTTVYGYGTSAAMASYPGPTFVVQRGVPITVKWMNFLPATHILDYAIDPTIPRASSSTAVRFRFGSVTRVGARTR